MPRSNSSRSWSQGEKKREVKGEREEEGDSETSSTHNNGHYILDIAHTHMHSLPLGPQSDLVD